MLNFNDQTTQVFSGYFMRRRLQFVSAVVAVIMGAITPNVSANTLFITGKVIHISDGDSLHLKPDNSERIKVRSAFYDSPEIGQRFGIEARDALRAFILGETVEIGCHKKDRYGRLVCVVYYGTVDVNHLMIKAGYGHFYKAYEHELSASDRQRYIDAEIEAQTAKAGLWSDSGVVTPWDYRRSQK